jgi:hypothetical protein
MKCSCFFWIEIYRKGFYDTLAKVDFPRILYLLDQIQSKERKYFLRDAAFVVLGIYFHYNPEV